MQFSNLADSFVYLTLISFSKINPIGLNFGPDLLDSVMICKSGMAKLSRIELSFISALVKIVSLPGTVSSDSNKLHLLREQLTLVMLDT